MRWVQRHKLAVILTLVGAALWGYTGIDYFILLAPVVFIVGLALRSLPCVFLWAVLATYGALVIPNGWVAVVVLALAVGFVPGLRGVSPLSDFRMAKRPGP